MSYAFEGVISMSLSKPYIIGISVNMGAGKKTLSLELANYLQDPYVGWYDFDEISKGPEDFIDWFQRGEDYSEWDYPQLAEALKSLKSGESVIHPTRNLALSPGYRNIFWNNFD